MAQDLCLIAWEKRVDVLVISEQYANSIIRNWYADTAQIYNI